jgi:hypothetical protein
VIYPRTKFGANATPFTTYSKHLPYLCASILPFTNTKTCPSSQKPDFSPTFILNPLALLLLSKNDSRNQSLPPPPEFSPPCPLRAFPVICECHIKQYDAFLGLLTRPPYQVCRHAKTHGPQLTTAARGDNDLRLTSTGIAMHTSSTARMGTETYNDRVNAY